MLEKNPGKRILEKEHESEEKFSSRSVSPSAESFLVVVTIPHSLRTPHVPRDMDGVVISSIHKLGNNLFQVVFSETLDLCLDLWSSVTV